MELSKWAEDHTGGLLLPPGRRWKHAQGVADVARDLARGLTPEDADVLVAAAYLHDIGYAKRLTDAVEQVEALRQLQIGARIPQPR